MYNIIYKYKIQYDDVRLEVDNVFIRQKPIA